MNRFYHEHSTSWIKHLLAILLFLGLFLAFFSGVSSVSQRTEEAQIETLEEAISRGIAHCYASEGHYPESLNYLIERYGITYDTDAFFVDYQALGGNIFPDVTIIKR